MLWILLFCIQICISAAFFGFIFLCFVLWEVVRWLFKGKLWQTAWLLTVPGPMRWVGFSIVVLRSTHWSGGPLMSDRSCNTLLLYCCCYYCYTLFETGLIGQAYMCQCGSHTRVVKATAQRVMLLKQQESAEWAGILAPNSPASSCSQLMTISLFMWVWCLCAGLQLNATLSSLKT